MENLYYWVLKDEEGVLRPLAGMWPAEGHVANYVQPDIDKLLSRKGFENHKVVKIKLVETGEVNK